MINPTPCLCLSPSLSLTPALGQIMLYVDGMNGLISHNETIQWLYTLVGSKVKNRNINHSRYAVKSTQQPHLCTDNTEIITHSCHCGPLGPLVARFCNVQQMRKLHGLSSLSPLFSVLINYLFALLCKYWNNIWHFFLETKSFSIILHGKFKLSFWPYSLGCLLSSRSAHVAAVQKC